MTKWSYRGISEFRQSTIKTTIDLIVDVAQLPFATRVAEKNREKIDHQDLKVCDLELQKCICYPFWNWGSWDWHVSKHLHGDQ